VGWGILVVLKMAGDVVPNGKSYRQAGKGIREVLQSVFEKRTPGCKVTCRPTSTSSNRSIVMATDKIDEYASDIDDFESEDEWENEETVEHVEQKHEEILKAISDGSVNLEDDAQADKFFRDNYKFLQAAGKRSFTIVHRVVNDMQDGSFERQKPLLKLLLEKSPDIFDAADFDGETALYMAVKTQQRNFVEFFCETSPDAAEALGIPFGSAGDTCLHDAIKRNAPFVEYLIRKCDKSTLTHQNDKGNTPLHIAVEYDKCTKTQIGVVESLLEKCESAMCERNYDKLSPYRYHLKTLHEPGTGGRGRESRGSNKAWGLKSNHEKRGVVDKNVRGRPQAKRNISKEERDKSAEEIRRKLKLHCMRSQTRDKVIDFLYGPYPSALVFSNIQVNKTLVFANLGFFSRQSD
jgi:hypothetical protein